MNFKRTFPSIPTSAHHHPSAARVVTRLAYNMAQSKATKKFEKRHLKDTLDRRNGLKKIKQKQQMKAKKKARRAEENGVDHKEEQGDQPKQNRGRQSAKDAFKDMSVDEILFIKCFDSESFKNKSIAALTPHTAFIDPQTPLGAAPRQSIEVRALVFYE